MNNLILGMLMLNLALDIALMMAVIYIIKRDEDESDNYMSSKEELDEFNQEFNDRLDGQL